MDAQITAAIISSGATLLAALIALPAIKKSILFKEKNKNYIKNPNRISVIAGKWQGQTIQEVGIGGSNMNVQLIMDLTTKNNLISGKTIVTWQENNINQYITVLIEGGFVSENFINILYQYHNGEIQNYGVMFLKLDASGKTLIGNMVGYGHSFENIVKGSTTFNKIG